MKSHWRSAIDRPAVVSQNSGVGFLPSRAKQAVAGQQTSNIGQPDVPTAHLRLTKCGPTQKRAQKLQKSEEASGLAVPGPQSLRIRTQTDALRSRSSFFRVFPFDFEWS